MSDHVLLTGPAPAFAGFPPPTSIKPCRYATLITFICWAVIVAIVAALLVLNARGQRRAATRATVSETADSDIAWELLGRTQLFENQNKSAAAASQPNHARDELLNARQNMVATPADQLYAVILARESDGAKAALYELRIASAKLPPHGQLRSDANILAAIYTSGPQSISAVDRLQLQTHMGWFGRLAVTQGLSADDPARVAIIQSSQRTMIALVIAGLLVVFGLLAGFALLIVFIVLFSIGKLQCNFSPVPILAAPVYLECFTLWLVGFIAMELIMGLLHFDPGLLVHELLFVLMTAALALWPLRRGVSWPELREALGWHRGQMIIIEILAGAAGYIAGLPIIALVIFVTTKLTHAVGHHPIEGEFNGTMTFAKALGLFVSAAVCAPLLEETIFRGALYYHLRRRWRPVISAVIVALIFAALHPQGWAAIPILGTIAMVLAALREWWGSMIASITAHAINNGMLVIFLCLALS